MGLSPLAMEEPIGGRGRSRTMTRLRVVSLLVAAFVLVALLSSCGGGGSGY
jgi:hypothetical protein